MRNLWYVRQGEKISGPYPEQLITHFVLLGRFKLQDQVSVDQVHWVALEEVRELLPAEPSPAENEKNPDKRSWRVERQRASQRWQDERHLPDRRDGKDGKARPNSKRSTRDRRKEEESEEVLALRQRHAENEVLLKKKRENFYATATILIAFAFALLGIVSVVSPVVPVKVGLKAAVADCMQPAGQQVNWSGCDKNGVNLLAANLKSAKLVGIRMQGAHMREVRLDYASLAGADMTLSDLSRAIFVGANLTGAELGSTNLSGADLRFADLRGARLEGADLRGALLGNAVWPNGKTCAPASVGQCL